MKDIIDEYNDVPIKQFINKSYFFDDESNLIMNTCIVGLNKTISIYGSFSYFQGKTLNENLTLLDATNSLKFLVGRDTTRDKLKFKLTNVSRNIPEIKDNKVYYFSIIVLALVKRENCQHKNQ